MRNSAWPSDMRIACCRAARAVKGSELREEESGTAAVSPHRGGFGEVSHVYFAKWEVLNLVPLQDCTCDHKRPLTLLRDLSRFPARGPAGPHGSWPWGQSPTV